MLELLALPLAGFFDRVRGGWPKGRRKWVKYPAMYAIGSLLLLQISSTWWIVLLAGPLMAQGWRQDNGWRGQWVVRQAVEVDMVLDGMRFGVLLPIFVLPLAAFETRILLLWPACIIGAPLGMWLSTLLPPLPKILDLRHAWPWSELISMPVIGLLLVLGETIWVK